MNGILPREFAFASHRPERATTQKTPVQSRSAASVDAMLEATLQVLVAVGKERLTTTRVAERAGVSVGTLYQYFPNKSSLLQATLRRHFDGVTAAILEVCASERGHTLESMGAELAERFLAAKLTDGKSSVALYAVSSDVDGTEIAQEVRMEMHGAVRGLLATASDGPIRDPDMVTAVLLGIFSGLSRQLLESPSPEAAYPSYREELRAVVGAYLATCGKAARV